MQHREVVYIVPEPLLNAAAAPGLRRDLLAVPPDTDIRLDLSGVRFCGVQGAASILAALNSREDAAGSVELFDPSGPALRCIAEYGLSEKATITVPVATER